MIRRETMAVAGMAIALGFGGTIGLRAEQRKADSNSEMHQNAPLEQREQSELSANFTDQGFVKMACMANTAEVKVCELALTKSKNDNVRSFAEHMSADHARLGRQLTDLAADKGWAVSDTIDSQHKTAMGQMAKLNGADFDKRYATGQVRDQEDAVGLFKLAVEKASDPDLKGWAKETLPKLQDDLKMARDLEEKTTATAMVGR